MKEKLLSWWSLVSCKIPGIALNVSVWTEVDRLWAFWKAEKKSFLSNVNWVMLSKYNIFSMLYEIHYLGYGETGYHYFPQIIVFTGNINRIFLQSNVTPFVFLLSYAHMFVCVLCIYKCDCMCVLVGVTVKSQYRC